MRIVTPSDINFQKGANDIVVFLGGSCSDKKNWRNSVINFLDKIEKDKVLSLENLVIINPFITKWNPTNEELQKEIEWESAMIDQSDIYSCYLDASSDNPITLFELGRALYQFKSKFAANRLNYRIVVSAHPDYARLDNVKFELIAATKSWKIPVTEINTDKNISMHSSKILEAYIKFSK